jgi:hypothetical protein
MTSDDGKTFCPNPSGDLIFKLYCVLSGLSTVSIHCIENTMEKLHLLLIYILHGQANQEFYKTDPGIKVLEYCFSKKSLDYIKKLFVVGRLECGGIDDAYIRGSILYAFVMANYWNGWTEIYSVDIMHNGWLIGAFRNFHNVYKKKVTRSILLFILATCTDITKYTNLNALSIELLDPSERFL